jgi:carotenoid cleavage dioxygenase-like enzyme
MNAQPNNASRSYANGYQPVTEEVFVEGLQVLGELPEQLDGTYLRIGLNPLGRPDPARDHVLAGDAMVHAVRLGGGRGRWYRNRWVRTDRIVRARGGLPTPGPRHGLSDNPNGNILRHAGRTLVLGDGGALPVALDTDLDSLARIDFDGTLPSGFSAHPAVDPVTGEMYAVAYYHELPYIMYLTIGTDGRVRRAAPIAMKSTSMMHAFSLTEHYAVIYDLPVTFDRRAVRAGSRVPYTWNENHGARLGILPREGGDADVLWVEIDPCYVFHPVNAYDTGNRIVLDVVRHDRVFDREPLLLGESEPTLWRWTVDRLSGMVRTEQLDDRVQEFPRIDERYGGALYRHAFTTAVRRNEGGAFAGPALLHHDLVAGRTEVHRLGPRREGGEPLFVPRTAWAPEGDGWVLSMVYNAHTDRSELIVLDTEDFTGPPVATVRLPVRVPHGLHGTWVFGD